MQERHTNRLLYFNEQSESTRQYVLPYIFENKLTNRNCGLCPQFPVQEIVKQVQNDEKCRVLEVGCGEGGNLLPFLELGHECYGVELTEWSYNNAVNFYAENPLKENLRLLNKNIYEVKPAELNGTFDIVFLRDVIEHIPEQERFMQHLKQFVSPQGVIFFAFPPWRMPFGGHQQVSRSKWVSHFPYIHLIPTTVLKWFGVSKNDINFLKILSETGISISRFEKILKTENYKILQKTHYFINPNYEIKFGLKPRKLYKIFQIPHLKDFYTSAMYYLVAPPNLPEGEAFGHNVALTTQNRTVVKASPSGRFGGALLSIIICTYNREKYLYDALKNIAENDFSTEKYEIVLVNNNSTDRTEAECERFQHDFPQVDFRYFVEANQGLSHARNKGIEESTSEVLIFLDDDAFVGKNYLENLTEYLSLHPEMSAFGGKITPVFESGKTPAWLSVWSNSFVSALDKGKNVKEFSGASYPIGANMGFYKKCLEKTGNFNVELGRKKKNLAGGEEKDLFNRFKENGFKIFYLPDIEVSHVIPESRTTYDYIQNLGLGVGASEYVRCAKQGKLKLFIRYVSELIKWGITLVLYLYYALLGQSPKGFALILFRKSVSKGLFFAKD